MSDSYLWWQRGIIYQIYPRSFQDSNRDGIGDLRGITSRLDHVRQLGVDAIWLSPIYPSPMADFGYDVSDYRDVHPMFGTLQDFDEMLREAHARGLKVLLDFVPNHTSDQHAWFRESRSSRDNPKRDWYLWKDPAPDGGPPNNWLSNFGGSGWEFDEATGQYYYHAFLPEQPDLNWRNPEVRQAMFDALRFWLDRGVDGFRVDVIWHMIKDADFRDNPPNPAWTPDQRPYDEFLPVRTADQPEVHEVIREMRAVFDEYDDRVMIGEIYLPVEKLVQYYGEEMSGAHLPFNFQLILAPWDARHIEQLIEEYEAALPNGGWPNWVLGNHDQHRIASRVGPEQARVAAMLLLTLRGTPTLYYGDEIGMHDVDIPHDRVQDPYEKNVPGRGLGRDPERTPMQWTGGRMAGFTTAAEAWLPIAEDHDVINVERQRGDPDSMLALHSRLIELRRGTAALEIGDFVPVAAHGDVLAYRREHGQERFLILLNLGDEPHGVDRGPEAVEGRIAVAIRRELEGTAVGRHVDLEPHDGLVIRLQPRPVRG